MGEYFRFHQNIPNYTNPDSGPEQNFGENRSRREVSHWLVAGIESGYPPEHWKIEISI